ncbi:DUF4136 domain-containing protein [Sphingomonas sp.]|uniref:DUF4136 domain-containing protein n=1 Tax=Sphingomonas sp. TaxID=28214 RepID=UPI00286A8DD1|nr:DUF4136 domain-containing protein [Sphingomonas sp.]
MNSITKLAGAMLIGASAIGLSGCATGFPTQVARYQAMPAPAGQTFFVVPMDARLSGSLEFQRFGSYVAQAMAAQGYAPAASAQAASLIVNVGYGVDRGTTEYVSDPFAYDRYGFGGFGYGGFYRPSYSRFGLYHSPFYYGWDDPFWYGGNDRRYIEYKSNLDLDIRRKGDNQSVFEGHARARSSTDDLNRIVPNLVEAMFTGFPGRNGETVKITVPPPGRAPAQARAY